MQFSSPSGPGTISALEDSRADSGAHVFPTFLYDYVDARMMTKPSLSDEGS